MLNNLYEVSRHSTCTRFFHGCIILFRKRKIVEACNDQGLFNHAEIQAVKKLCSMFKQKKKINRCKLYVGRFSPSGTTHLSRPCRLCQETIKKIGIKKIYYTTEKSTFQRLSDDETCEYSPAMKRCSSPTLEADKKTFFQRFRLK